MMNKLYLFNNDIETGLRVLIILHAANPEAIDIQRIMYYDYLAIHSGDVENGPSSIHPATPNRTGEILVRRKIIEEGINSFVKRGLINKNFSHDGIDFCASDNASIFLDLLEEEYTNQLKHRAKWVVENFSHFSIKKLNTYMKNNLDNWGGEFMYCTSEVN